MHTLSEYRYGKDEIHLYRTMRGDGFSHPALIEATFAIRIEGDFWESAVSGDNSRLIATDSMRELLTHVAASEPEWTPVPLAEAVAMTMVDRYKHLTRAVVDCEVVVSSVEPNAVWGCPSLVERPRAAEGAFATVAAQRSDGTVEVVSRRAGIKLQVAKLGNNSFAGYFRDEFTKLPEDSDRDLFLDFEVAWNVSDAESPDALKGRLRDISIRTIAEAHASSIQHLLYEVGIRCLDAASGLDEVSLRGVNRSWVPVEVLDEQTRTYTAPNPAPGVIDLVVARQPSARRA